MCHKGPVGGAALMAVIVFFLYTVAFIAPTWAVSSSGFLGIWLSCSNGSCDYAGKDFTSEGYWFLLIVEVLASVAMLATILALILGIATARRTSVGNIFHVGGLFIVSLIAGGTMTATLVYFTMQYSGDKSFSFSYYATVVSVVLCYISSILCCAYLKCPGQYDDEVPLISEPSEVH